MSGRKNRLKTKKVAVAKVPPMDPELVIWLRAALVELWTNGHKPNGLRMAQTEAELPQSCECTKQQVAAHKAWLRMYMENAIKEAGISCHWFDAIRIWGSIKLDGLVPEIEDIYPEHIEKAAREVNCEVPSDFSGFKQACLLFENSLFKSDRVLGKTADLVAYNQKIKALWRETWKRFLERYWPVNEEARIVCLPGRRPEREIGVYRQLGYPGFVDGVEGGSPQAKNEFSARMEFLGIQFHGGTDRLERSLIDRNIRYQVVSLDLIGPYSRITEQILSRLRLDQRAWLMINLQAAREKDSGSAALAAAYRSFANQKRLQLLRGELRQTSYWTEGCRKKILDYFNSGAEAETTDLSTHRESAQDSLLLNRLGMQLMEYSVHEAIMPQLAPFIENGMLRADNIGAEALAVDGWIYGRLFNGAQPALILAYSQHLSRGSEMMMDVVTGRPKVKHVEKYSYSSRMGRKSTTFFTTMAEVHSADYLSSRYSEFRKSVGFYLDCARARKAGTFQIEILDRTGRLKANGQQIEYDDQMHLVGAPVHRDISFRRHLEDLQKYEKLLGEYPGSNPIEVEKLPRIELIAA